MDGQWLAAEIATASGDTLRWGPDEADIGSIPSAITFSSKRYGGDDTASLTLSRPPSLADDDARLFRDVRIYGPGYETAWTGRVVGVPQVGPSEIRIECEGKIAVLNERFISEIYRDADMTQWGEASPARRAALGTTYTIFSPQLRPSVPGPSAVDLTLTTPWGGQAVCDAVYDSKEVEVGSIYYSWSQINANVSVDFGWTVSGRSSESGATVISTTADLQAAGPGAGTLTVAAGADVGWVTFFNTGARPGDQTEHTVLWDALVVYGRHDLTKRGTEPAAGFYGSDILGHALSGSGLNYTTGDSIETADFVIGQLAYLQPTSLRQVVEDVSKFGLTGFTPPDWGVHDGTFYWRSPGTYGRSWRLRRDQFATPTASGPDAAERYGGIIVLYTDSAGQSRSVGPVGSGAAVEDASLQITDTTDAAYNRFTTFDAGTTNQAAAIQLGQVKLANVNTLRWRGSVEVQGEVTDENGIKYPPWAMRGGDRVIVEDDPDFGEQTIFDTSYSHDEIKTTANLGASPYRLDVALARLAA